MIPRAGSDLGRAGRSRRAAGGSWTSDNLHKGAAVWTRAGYLQQFTPALSSEERKRVDLERRFSAQQRLPLSLEEAPKAIL